MTIVVRSHHILVHAPLQFTFDYVSDLTRHPEWSGGELKIEAVTSGPVAVGQTRCGSRNTSRQINLVLLPTILISGMFRTYLHLQSKMGRFSSHGP
jgi:hypothetical protein